MSMSNRAEFLKQLSDLEKLSQYTDGLHNLRKAVFQKERNIHSAHVIDYDRQKALVIHYEIEGETYTTISVIVPGEAEADIAYNLETKLLKMMHIKHLEDQRRIVEQDKIQLQREHNARMEAACERGCLLDQQIAEAWKK